MVGASGPRRGSCGGFHAELHLVAQVVSPERFGVQPAQLQAGTTYVIESASLTQDAEILDPREDPFGVPLERSSSTDVPGGGR